jgi:Hint domain
LNYYEWGIPMSFQVAQIPCFVSGTRILADGGEIAVEQLRIGDLVVTKSGETRPIKWIGRRSYSERFTLGAKHLLPICVKAGALSDGVPRRDLWVSPNHALYLDGVLIGAGDLVNGISVVQAERFASLEYFHIELETHDVIISEGAFSETFIEDDNRSVFHNAHEFRTLYPSAPTEQARYCAPRVCEGGELERARQRIALRAGCNNDIEGQLELGGLRGFIDEIGQSRIAGWAQSVGCPEAPVRLEIYLKGERIGELLANRYRPDLEKAGLGSGCHSFEFIAPQGTCLSPDAIEVRRSLDGALLHPSSLRTPTGLQERLVGTA